MLPSTASREEDNRVIKPTRRGSLAASAHASFVFIVDDDASIRQSLEALIRRAGWEPRTSASVEQFLTVPPVLAPSCLVVEPYLPGLSGLDLQRLLLDRAPLPIIFLAKSADVATTVQAMKAGAFEFLTKPLDEAVLVNVIRCALERSAQELREHSWTHALVERYESLSRREREVMALVVNGRSNKQAGVELYISEATVKAHRGNIMRKMQARSFAELVTLGRSLGAMPQREAPSSSNGSCVYAPRFQQKEATNPMSRDVKGTPYLPKRRALLGGGLAFFVASEMAPLDALADVSGHAVSGPTLETQRWFPGFEPFRIELTEAVITGVKGGRGPPVLLLHGYPETHLEWHRVAPALAQRFTVVAPDLRGYGASSKPPDGDNHEGYSKRSMARDQVALMSHFGFDHFPVVGHDRGARVAHRMALDYPSVVSRLAVLDIVPNYTIFSSVTGATASAYYFWFLMLQAAPLPETLLSNSADFYLRNGLFSGSIPSVIPEEIYAQYLRSYQDPATLHATCEDFRASATIDLEHDKADLATKLRCPLLALWSAHGGAAFYDVLATWGERASDVRGRALPGGHWLPEQLPEELNAELLRFLV